MRVQTKWSLLCAAIAMAVPVVRGDVIFSSFGPNNTYDPLLSFSASGANSSTTTYYQTGARFVAGATGLVTEIDFGLTRPNSTDSGTVDAYLYGDAAGMPNNAIQLFLGSVTATAPFTSTNNAIVTLFPAVPVLVNFGTTYWLVLKPDATNTYVGWNASTGTPGPQYTSRADLNWFAQPATNESAFRIIAVPEPQTMALLFSGGVSLVLVRRRNKAR